MIDKVAVLMLSIALAGCASAGPEAVANGPNGGDQAGGVETSDGELAFADTPQAEQVAAVEVEPRDEIICRRERPAGSNMSRRVCFTRSQMEGRAAADQETIRNSRTLSPSSTQEFGNQ